MTEQRASDGEPKIGPAEAVARAVAAFQAHPGADDDTIHAALKAGGFSELLSTRLLQLLPIAFCRVLLSPQGVKFPDLYRVMGPKGVHLGDFPLSEEPIFTEALAAARREIEAGRGGAPYLAIAGRSGGFKAVMELVGKGSNIDGIVCAAPILMCDEHTWQRDAFAVEAPRKAWWQRWPGKR
jgi:hypothetical protein